MAARAGQAKKTGTGQKAKERTGQKAKTRTGARAKARTRPRAKVCLPVSEPKIAEKTPEQPPLRPSQCRSYMRNTLAREFRTIVQGFVKGAQSGSCQHVKLATELLEPRARKPKVQSSRSTLERWVDEIERGI